MMHIKAILSRGYKEDGERIDFRVWEGKARSTGHCNSPGYGSQQLEETETECQEYVCVLKNAKP